MISKLGEDEFNESDLGKFTEMLSSDSYLIQKKNEIYQLKYDMFMTFESDKGKDYTCAISSWVLKVGASKGQISYH